MSNDRDETIKRIKTALQKRSGKPWSVTGGRGTAWGWITIDAPPSRRTWARRVIEGSHGPDEQYEDYDTGSTEGYGYMSPSDRKELAQLMGLEYVHFQGISIASSSDHYREHIERAEGRTPAKIAEPYWD